MSSYNINNRGPPYRVSIASKEADETDYWLNMLHDNGYLNE